MFSVFATLCLSAMPEICREVMIPAPDTSAAICQTSADEVAQAWAARSGLYDVKSASCRAAEGGLTFAKIGPGVYAHVGHIGLPNGENLGDISNMGFVVGSQSVAVFDTGGSRAVGEAALVGLREITDLPISHVFLAHMHPDHVFGATVFAETGAQIVGHPNLQEAMDLRGANYSASLSRLIGPAGFLGSEIPQVDETVESSRLFDIGERQLEIRSVGTAHSNTDLVMIDQSSGTLFASDLVFLVHTPALDGSLRGWQEVLRELADLSVEQVVPGHGPVASFPKALAPTREYLDALADSTKEQLDAGVSLSAAAPVIAQSERENWELFDEFNTRNATGAYAEIEWE